MKRPLVFITIFGLVLSAGWGLARAEQGGDRGKTGSGRDTFSWAVDLERFRTGNIEWDTQELIVSGLSALHQEHLKLLDEVAELKGRLKKIEGK